MLGPNGAEGMTVLDLFAGTGAVGFDLLEHGAAKVDFVEIDHRRAAAIKTEIQNRRLESRATTYTSDAINILPKLTGNRYDIVFADPPYEMVPWEQLIADLQTHNLLKPNAWIIAEHATRNSLPEKIPRATATKRRRYGDSAITIYQLTNQDS